MNLFNTDIPDFDRYARALYGEGVKNRSLWTEHSMGATTMELGEMKEG